MSGARGIFVGISLWVSISGTASAEAPPFALGEKETIVFVGDSITAAGHYVRYVEAYLRTRFPERAFRIVPAGRRSETVSGLSEPDHPGPRPVLFDRFERDVVPSAPTWIVAAYGMNDGIYHPWSEERFGCYRQGIGQLAAQARAMKARLLILTPPVWDAAGRGEPELAKGEAYSYKKPFPGYDEVLGRYSAWLMTLRSAEVDVADVHTAFRHHLDTHREMDAAFRLQRDSIHPDATGHLLIAMAVLTAWNAPDLVSEHTIDAKGGKEVAFAWTPKLPMPMDETWDAASVALERFTERFNRQPLAVTGLREGRYDLAADGAAVGTFTAGALAGGVELSGLETFPTTARSREVLMTLRKRAAADAVQAAVLDARLLELCTPRSIAITVRLAVGGQP